MSLRKNLRGVLGFWKAEAGMISYVSEITGKKNVVV